MLPVHPSIQDIACMLYACAKDKRLGQLFRVHTYMCQTGLDREASLGNLLVMLLVDAGGVCYAQQLFNRLMYRDERSWNALIVGFAKSDEPCTALNLYQKMQRDDSLCLSGYSLWILVRSCATLKDLERGCALHAEIARQGLAEIDVFFGSTLVDMYAKCGSVLKSQEVFDKLVLRDVVSWTALIAGYAEHGHCEEVFDCAKRMQYEGISLNSFTLQCMLKVCGIDAAVEKGQAVHIEIAKKGLERELVIGNSLVDMYVKCGHLEVAYAAFEGLPVRDVISWTTLIAGYADCGWSNEALNCYEQMQYNGSPSNAITFVCTLKACGSMGATDKGQQVHRDIVLKGLENDLRIGNTLVDMYFKCGLLADGEVVFDKLPIHDVISWNVLMTGYADRSSGNEALLCFERMQHKGFSLNAATFVCLVKACGKAGDKNKGGEIHAYVIKSGFDQDLPVANSLIDMYGKFGLLADAQYVFDKIPIRSLVSWNALIGGYTEHMCADEALHFFEQMRHKGICPDAVTLVCCLKSCGTVGTKIKGQEIHVEIAKLGMEEELLVGNSLINMYGKCDMLAEAQEVLDRLGARDVVSWTALMAGYAQLGKSETVLVTFEKMIREGIRPNSVTITCILNACSDEGLVFAGEKYFDAMTNDSGLVPTLEQYTSLIDLLGRAGLLDQAFLLIGEMPINPDIVVWLTVLGACRKWSNVGLGRIAFESAVRLDRKSEAAYICMYSIYIEAGMCNEACKVEVRRAQNQA